MTDEDREKDPQAAGPAEGATRGKRRSVLRAMFGSLVGLGFTALGAAAGLWTAGTARFMMPNVVTEAARKFKVGLPGDYPPGHVATKYKRDYGVWVVRGEYGGRQQIFALSTVCTHLGCITLWEQNAGRFKCPCHGSGFRRDGVNFEGPAPRPLERFAIQIAADGQLEIDRSRVFQEELGQWKDPDCFVLM